MILYIILFIGCSPYCPYCPFTPVLFSPPHSRIFSSALEKKLLCGGEILDIHKIIFTKFVNSKKNAYLCIIKCQQYGH